MAEGFRPNQKNSDLPIVLLLLFLAGCFYYFYESIDTRAPNRKDPGTPSEVISARSKRAEELVNRYIKTTNSKIEISKSQREIENKYKAPEIGQVIIEPENYDPKLEGTNINSDRSLDALERDLNKGKETQTYYLPHNEVLNDMAERQKAEEAYVAERKAYAKQFIENAKRNGFEVTLNENYQVTSVKKISQPEKDSTQLFEDSSATTSHSSPHQ